MGNQRMLVGALTASAVAQPAGGATVEAGLADELGVGLHQRAYRRVFLVSMFVSACVLSMASALKGGIERRRGRPVSAPATG
jgi:hypothetical protein